MADPPGPSRSTVGGSPFPPIADYAFISDCEVCALVAPSGNVEWMCLPRMDGPSIFAAMLDRHAGWFRLGPADVTSGLHLGNFPQAFSHLALINAVVHLIRVDEQLSDEAALAGGPGPTVAGVEAISGT
jgi:GH15 family glucan-1,4-alpha-glucosidase